MTDDPRNILVFHPAGIGDAVLGTPTLRALRDRYPASWITLITSRRALPVIESCRHTNEVLALGIEEKPVSIFNRIRSSDLMHIWRHCRQRKYDLLLDLTRIGSRLGGWKRAVMFRAIGARKNIGRNTNGFGSYLDESLPDPPSEPRHEVERCLEVATLAGCSKADPTLEVFLDDTDRAGAEKALAANNCRENLLIGINPNANWPSKMWPADFVVAAADALQSQHNASVILIGGPNDMDSVAAICEKMQRPAINLAGTLSLPETAALFEKLDLFVTNDSGPMHLAAAVGTATVAIFGPVDPRTHRPYGLGNRCRVLCKRELCDPACDILCARDEHKCMHAITVDDVVTAAGELLV